MIINKFNLNNLINQRITFKDFFSNANIRNIEEKRIRKSISSIYLKSILNQETVNIRKFENENYVYSEIFLLEILLNDNNNIRQIEDVLHETFQNPIIIIFEFNKTYRISVAPKRLSKITAQETVIEDTSFTPFFKIDNSLTNQYTDKLDLYKVDAIDLKELYEFYYVWTKLFIILEMFKKLPNIDLGRPHMNLLDKLEDSNSAINSLEEQKQKQRQVADKMYLHQKIIQEKNNRNNIINQIKENVL